MAKHVLQFTASPDNLPIIRHFVSLHLKNYFQDPVKLNQITVAVEELCANSIIHGNNSNPTTELRLELRMQGSKLHIYLYDPAPPFDLYEYPAEPTLLRKDTNRPGGLGIYLIRKLIDKITVRKRSGHSVYHLVKELQ